jgi:hypothetical protein
MKPDDFLRVPKQSIYTITDWIIAAALVGVIVWCFYDAGWFV